MVEKKYYTIQYEDCRCFRDCNCLNWNIYENGDFYIPVATKDLAEHIAKCLNAYEESKLETKLGDFSKVIKRIEEIKSIIKNPVVLKEKKK